MKVSDNYYDERFSFLGIWEVPSLCGLKIIHKTAATYVIVTELYQENPGTSVTAAGIRLARQICEKKGLNLAEITYLECNPDTHSKLSFYEEAYFQVDFRDETQPAYRQLTPEEVQQLFD